MTTNIEREIFESLVDALMRQNAIKEEMKDISARAKEYELDVKALKAAAKFYVESNFAEKEEEFERIKSTYNLMAS